MAPETAEGKAIKAVGKIDCGDSYEEVGRERGREREREGERGRRR